MKSFIIITGLFLSSGPIFAQAQDYLQYNRKFKKTGYSKSKTENQLVSSMITALAPTNPLDYNHKFHRKTITLATQPVLTDPKDQYLARNRKFHRGNNKDAE